MTDDKSKRGKPDRRRVALTQSYEVTAFCRRHRCDELHLALAVQAVGDVRVLVVDALARARSLLSASRRQRSKRRKPSK